MVGRTISHYRLLEKIGEGGMGVVYKAEDTKLHRTVALKFLRPDAIDTEELKERFLHEAEAAAALNHPNVCTVYDIDEAEGHSFIAMERVEGESLAEKVNKRPLPLDEALDISIQVAEGLHAAHKKGIVHRDIKSANIMINTEGRVKIMDFGLAHLTGGTRITKTGTVVGTPAYMSPEQVRGEEVDLRTDIWSLGVVLYEMVTGQLPFKGEVEEAVSHSILYERPDPLTAVRTGVPMELDRIAGKALEKSSDQRYQHMDEMLVDLRSISRQRSTGETTPLPVRVEPVRKTRLIALAAILVLGVSLISLGLYLRRDQRVGAPGEASVAVLPLDNLSGDPQEEYFADGLTEALIADLAKIRSLRVISRTTVMRYKDSDKPLPEIARELKVGHIVGGSALRVASRVRITAQLVEAATDQHLWAESYERDYTEVLAVQSEVARAIARAVNATLTPEDEARLSGGRTVNQDAYEAYLKGTFWFNKSTPQGLTESIGHFERAVAADPGYAPPYAALARACTLAGPLAGVPGLFPKAKEAALKAVELDDTLATSHTSLGAVYGLEWDWAGCRRELERAIQLEPDYGNAHHIYANVCLLPVGRLDDALTEIQRARELEPHYLFHRAVLGVILYCRREYDQAIDELNEVLEMTPANLDTYRVLGMAYRAKGMHEEAIEACQKAAEFSRTDRSLAILGHSLAVAGQEEEARTVLEELRGQAIDGSVSPWSIAAVHIGLGENDRAFEWLNQAYRERDFWLTWLKVDPIYDGLRSDQRFTDLLNMMGLEP